MSVVWKYLVPVQDRVELELPRGSMICHVAADGPTGLLVWAIVDPAQPREIVHLRVYGTGHEIGQGNLEHIGTVQAGPYVWHVFEEWHMDESSELAVSAGAVA